MNQAAKKAVSVLCMGSTLLFYGVPGFGQTPVPPPPPADQQTAPQQPVLRPEQLDNLVAPIALYPDPLLGQVLAASTYPLEIVEAKQWRDQNSNLRGQAMIDAARQQSWDPSVQALVAFPDALSLLTRDVQWTTDLGNAFLAQQSDVMAAVQRMRVRAQQNGKLATTPQQVVTTQNQNGQSAVVIDPPDPQVIYVPVYNPAYVWGPPAWGYYPPLAYPGIGFGFGFGPGIFLSSFFPGWGFGWGGWGLGWGWGCGWFGGGLFVNSFFFNHWGFHGGYGGYYGGRYLAGGRWGWAHDPYHRAGVAYANRGVAARFDNSRFAAGRYSAGSSFSARSYAGGARGFNSAGSAYRGSGSNGNYNRGSAGAYSRSYSNPGSTGSINRGSNNRGYSAPNASRGYSNPGSSYNRGFSSPNAGRSYSAPSSSYNRSYSAPSSNRSYSAPSSNRSYSAPSYNRSYSAPNYGTRGGFSAPRPSGGGFSGMSRPSAPRSSGGGSHFSGGGHASGGGSHGRR